MSVEYFYAFANSILKNTSSSVDLALLNFHTRYILSNVERSSEVFEILTEFVFEIDRGGCSEALSKLNQFDRLCKNTVFEFDVFPNQKTYDILGVRCVFVGSGLEDVELLSEYISTVERALNTIHKSSIKYLSAPLRIDIPIYISLLKNWPLGEGKEEGLLAAYESRAEILLIFPESLTSETDLAASIGHEYGHFLYENRIEERLIELWESSYEKGKMELNLNKVYESRKFFDSDEAFDLYMRKFAPTTWFQIHTLFYKEELCDFKIYDVRSLCEAYSNNGEGFELAPVLVEKSPITQYSIVSAQEAFCEGLGLMLAQDFRTIEQIEELKGPRQLSTIQTNMLMSMLRSALHF